MTAPTIERTFSTSCSKHETAKQWLQRRLRRIPSIHPGGENSNAGLRGHMSDQRPRTAPSPETIVAIDPIPAVPPLPMNMRPPLHATSIRLPPQLQRVDTGVMRDVDAWLDTSMNLRSPPLMGGIPYWRKATAANARNTAAMQHATPIVREANDSLLTATQGSHAKLFRRHAKKIQVQMPLLARNRSVRDATQKQVDRRSNSMPIFSITYEMTRQGALPLPMPDSTLHLVSVKAPTRPNQITPSGELQIEQIQICHGTPTSGRDDEVDASTGQRMYAILGRSTTSADSIRPSTAAAHMAREDSMGDLSDVPSYFSGLAPPSYESRPASILTTSSFGCIDGMNTAQRQISQQRAAMQRGMKGKLKRLARNLKTTGN
jgi:hypothetical protein